MNRRSTMNRDQQEINIEQDWTTLNTIEHHWTQQHSNTATQQHSNTLWTLSNMSDEWWVNVEWYEWWVMSDEWTLSDMSDEWWVMWTHLQQHSNTATQQHSNTATQQHSNTATLLYHVSLWYQGAETGYRVRTPYRSDVKHKWGHRGQLSPIWTHFFSSLTKSWGGEGIQQKQNIQLLGTNNPIGSLPSQILCSLWSFE